MFFHGLWVHYVHLLNTAGGPELVFPPITAGFPPTKTPDSLLQISESLRLVLTTERAGSTGSTLCVHRRAGFSRPVADVMQSHCGCGEESFTLSH